MFDIFFNTTRVAKELLGKRNDPNDRRLGELIASDPSAYESRAIVLLGCPQDEGVRRVGGRPGAALAPAGIRRALFRLSPLDLVPELLFDLGDTHIQDTLEATHDLQFRIVQQILRDGKSVIVLGGGNDISFPDCAALAAESRALLAFNIDAHFDVRADIEPNSGTPYRQLLEANLLSPGAFFEMGSQREVNSPVYREYLREKGVTCFTLEDLRSGNMQSLFRRIIGEQRPDRIFWGFDIDSVRAADAPGVSAPSPRGLTADELLDLTHLAGLTPETRIVEFTEVNPRVDRDDQTSRLVAFAIHQYLRGVCEREGSR